VGLVVETKRISTTSLYNTSRVGITLSFKMVLYLGGLISVSESVGGVIIIVIPVVPIFSILFTFKALSPK